MNQFTLKFKWIALAFAVITLFGAYLFIGQADYGSQDAGISDTPPPAVAQNEAAAPAPPVTDEAEDATFDDEDDASSIDDANGDDPVPDDNLDGGNDNSDQGDFADSAGDDSGSTISSQPPQFTSDGTAIVPGNS